MSEPQQFITYETALGSIISDSFTFGVLLGGFWLNYEFIGNSVILQLIMGFCFFRWVLAKGNKKIRRLSRKDAIEYLQARGEQQ